MNGSVCRKQYYFNRKPPQCQQSAAVGGVSMELKVIATVKSDFPTNFGLPRQSGIIPGLKSSIVFEKEYSVAEAFRGLEDYTHIWVVWGFSSAVRESWSPTVRPPRLGGNTRTGVFATRSPFRPNPVGLSCVKLSGISRKDGRVILEIEGADMMDGTPVYDIKPYLPFTDSHPDAASGFAGKTGGDRLDAVIPERLAALIPEDKREPLLGILRSDPRPSYQNEPDRVYGFVFAGAEIRFRVTDGIAEVVDVK